MYLPRIMHGDHSESQPRRDPILDFYNLLLAMFLFVSPWLFAYSSGAARIDFWTGGALIAMVSAAAIAAYSDWEEWLNLMVGIWLVLAPWVLGFAHTRAMHISIGAGIFIAFLAALALWLEHYRNPSAS